MRATSVILVFIAVVLVFGYVLFGRSATYDTAQLYKDLETLFVPALEYQNETYRFTESGIMPRPATSADTSTLLHIARYATIMRLDPIFSVEGTSPDLLRENTNLLSQTTSEIASVYSEEEATIIERSLYPFEFLHTLGPLEARRQEMLRAPSTVSIDGYHTALLRAIDAYIFSADLLIEALRSPYMEKTNGTFAFWGGVSDVETLIDKIEVLKQAALEKKELAVVRYECITTDLLECEAATEVFARMSVAHPVEPSTYDDSDMRRAKTVQSLLHALYSNIADLGARQEKAIVTIRESACYPNGAPTFYFPRDVIEEERPKTVRHDILNDLFFYETAGAAGEYFAAHRNHGIELTHQAGGNPYMCLDSGMDYALVGAATHIRESLAGLAPLQFSPGSSLAPRLRSIHEYEASIASSDSIDAATVHQYLTEWLSLVKEYSESGVIREVGEDAWRDRMQLIAFWNQGSSSFDDAILTLAHSNIWITNDAEIGQPDVFTIMFLTRSYPSFLFLPFNQSVYPKEDFTFYKRKEPIDFSKFRMIRYFEDLTDRYTEEEILEDMRQTREIFYRIQGYESR